MKMKHNRPQKRLIIQLSLWLALLLTFTGCAGKHRHAAGQYLCDRAAGDDPFRIAGGIGDRNIGTRIRTAAGILFGYTRSAAGHICNRCSDRRGHVSIFPPGDSGILRHTLYRSQWQQTLFHRSRSDYTVLRDIQRAG